MWILCIVISWSVVIYIWSYHFLTRSLSETSVTQVAKPTVPVTGSTIPTVVGRNVMPRMSPPNTSSSDLTNGLNGAAPKRPHSPSLEEPHKKLKDTEQVNSPLPPKLLYIVHCNMQVHSALVRFLTWCLVKHSLLFALSDLVHSLNSFYVYLLNFASILSYSSEPFLLLYSRYLLMKIHLKNHTHLPLMARKQEMAQQG